MSKIAIVTDSTAMLSKSEIADYANLYVVPISVELNGKVYREGIDIENEEFFDLLDSSSTFPKTAPPSLGDMDELYTKIFDAGFETILSIHITSGITGFIDNLRVFAQNIDRGQVVVYDSQLTIQPMGALVKRAAALAQAGRSVEDITAELDQIRATFGEYFIVDDLNNLVKGGRLSNSSAFLGNLLRVKPLLTMMNEQHKIVGIGKERTLKKARKVIIQKTLAEIEKATEPMQMFLVGTHNQKEIENWKKEVEKLAPTVKITTGQIGPVVGAHIGSNAFVVLWMKDI